MLTVGKGGQGKAATQTIFGGNSHSVLELSGESVSRNPLRIV